MASLGGLAGVGATLALRAVVLWRAGGGGGEGRFLVFAIDPVIFLQAAVITVLTGMIAGVAPALYETRRLHTNPLRTLAASDRVRQRWRHTLVVAEIVVTVALFVRNRGVDRRLPADAGRRDGVRDAAPHDGLGGKPRRHRDRVDARAIRRIPGVAGVAAATAAPFAGAAARERVAGDAGGSNAVLVERATVTGDFFSTLGVAMRAGRTFSSQDSPAARIAVANESLAKRLFPGASAVGQRIWIAGAAARHRRRRRGLFAQSDAGRPARIRGSSCRSRRTRRTCAGWRSSSAPSRIPGRSSSRCGARAPEAAPGTIVTSAYTFDQIRTSGARRS